METYDTAGRMVEASRTIDSSSSEAPPALRPVDKLKHVLPRGLVMGTGLEALGVSFLLPGTGAASLWQLVAMGAVIGFYIGAVSLLPFGYCDGTMLFHLLLRTRRGEELTSRILRGANLRANGAS